ncbi:hypothetical protein [Hymenobacter actinosclerus]|nr:hypothetical protein [Hymenobacter actinosclerus]
MIVVSAAQFQQLPYQRQQLYFNQYATYFNQRWHHNYSIELYCLGNFYCELWLEQESRQRHHYIALAADACLAAYSLAPHETDY